MHIGKVIQIGSSLGVVLPAPVRRSMGVLRGDYVQIDEAGGEVTIRSNDAKKTTLTKRSGRLSTSAILGRHGPK